MRDGADHLLTAAYDNKSLAICPVRAVEQYIQIGSAVGWDMTKGYLFPTISTGPRKTRPLRVLPGFGCSDDKSSEGIRFRRRRTTGVFYALVPTWKSHFSSASGRESTIYHTAGILEAAQHRMEVHAFNADCGPRLGILVDDQRDLRGTVSAHQ